MNDIEVKVGGMSEHRKANRAGRQVTNFTQDDDNQIVDLATLRVAYTQNTRRITKGNSSSGRHALFLNAQFRQSFFDLFDYLRVGFGFHFLRRVAQSIRSLRLTTVRALGITRFVGCRAFVAYVAHSPCRLPPDSLLRFLRWFDIPWVSIRVFV